MSANMKATDKGQQFIESRKRLVALDISDHEFCCDYHRIAFCNIQERAGQRGKDMTVAQMDYARSIYKGEAKHQRDPNEQVTAYCVFKVAKKVEGQTKKVMASCLASFKGTRKEIGSWNTCCPKHRTK